MLFASKKKDQILVIKREYISTGRTMDCLSWKATLGMLS